MPAILKIQIWYNIEVKDIQAKIENERFEILALESLKFEYNTKTGRITQELIKKGFNPVKVKYSDRKENYENNLLQFMITKPKNSYKKWKRNKSKQKTILFFWNFYAPWKTVKTFSTFFMPL